MTMRTPTKNARPDDFKARDTSSVFISHKAHQKLLCYIENVKEEVSGMGLVERFTSDDGTYTSDCIYVKDVFLLDQEVTGSTTDFTGAAMAKFFQERQEADPNDDLGGYKLWWHSHSDFGVFWSPTDETAIDSFDQEVDTNNWFLSIVGNHKGDLLARIDVYRPFRMTINKIPIIVEDIEPSLKEELVKEIKEKVTVKTFTHAKKKTFGVGTGTPQNSSDTNSGITVYQDGKQYKYDPTESDKHPWDDDWDVLEFAERVVEDYTRWGAIPHSVSNIIDASKDKGERLSKGEKRVLKKTFKELKKKLPKQADDPELNYIEDAIEDLEIQEEKKVKKHRKNKSKKKKK